MPPPDTHPANEQGDIDLIFHVKEKRTGNVNFGASVGQGTGVGGFIGFDQPNLFGECKKGSLQWQFGQYIRDFSLSYTDPRIKQSNVSGTVSRTTSCRASSFATSVSRTPAAASCSSASRCRTRSDDALLHELRRRAGELRRRRARLDDQLQRLLPVDASGSRSTTIRDSACRSRYAGTHENVALQLNGGPLGRQCVVPAADDGDAYLFHAGDVRQAAWAPSRWRWCWDSPRAPARCSANPGPFFVSQAFSLGGVQYGNPLRGYEEFSITPQGYLPNADQFQAQRSSFGNAYYTSTAELGPARESAALPRCVLRRRQHLGAPARLRSDAALSRCRLRGVARHSAGSAGRRPRLRVRSHGRAGAKGSQVAGSFQVRSDLLIGVSMRSMLRATAIALVVHGGGWRRAGARQPLQDRVREYPGADGGRPGPRRGRVDAAEGGRGVPRADHEDAGFDQRAAREVPEGRADAERDRQGHAPEGASRRSRRSCRRQQLKFQQQFAQRQTEVMAPITDVVKKVLDDIRTEDGYAMILVERSADDEHRVGGQEPRHHRSRRVAPARRRRRRRSRPRTPKKAGAPAAPAGVTRPPASRRRSDRRESSRESHEAAAVRAASLSPPPLLRRRWADG